MLENKSQPFPDILDQLPFDIVASSPIFEGSNNRLFHLITIDGKSLLLKQYFQDDRRRMYREWNIFKELHKHGITNVPKPIFAEHEEQFAIYEFIVGVKKLATDLSRDDLARMAEFIAELHSITPATVKTQIPSAIMNALSLDQIVSLIRARIESIKDEIAKSICHPLLAEFIRSNNVLHRLQYALHRFSNTIGDTAMHETINVKYRRLSPTDFGPHNIIFRPNAPPAFIDFEYGGWDHPMRVLADFVNHDRSQGVSSADIDFFLRHYRKHSPLDQSVLTMLPNMRHLAGIEWLMIYISSMNNSKLKARRFSNPNFDEVAYIMGQIQKTKYRLHLLDV